MKRAREREREREKGEGEECGWVRLGRSSYLDRASGGGTLATHATAVARRSK